jgi:hypothetical protein
VPGTLNDILGPEGAIARRLGERYEFRPQQLEMATAVERRLYADPGSQGGGTAADIDGSTLSTAMRRLAVPLVASIVVLLAGCDALGIESAEKIAAARQADGRAIGSACRHAARAIEDCYAIYRKADRAAIFAGWRDMNDYMRENKIEPVAPQLAAQLGSAREPASSERPAKE